MVNSPALRLFCDYVPHDAEIVPVNDHMGSGDIAAIFSVDPLLSVSALPVVVLSSVSLAGNTKPPVSL